MTAGALKAAEQPHVPDVLETLAQLPNDEVFTPPKVANAMLDILPAGLWSQPAYTWLDPATKSGVFLREIFKRLMVGLQSWQPDAAKRREHILRHMLYGAAITTLSADISRRSVYQTKNATGAGVVDLAIKDWVVPFDDSEGNIKYVETQHTLDGKGKHCTICRAPASLIRDRREHFAYSFTHRTYPTKEMATMNFDVIVGNPPYQIGMDDGKGNKTANVTPLYNQFVEKAIALNPRYVLMITPSRWFAGGKGLPEFRKRMIKDRRLRAIVDNPLLHDVFPQVTIKGGVSYFLWDRDYEGDCAFSTRIGGTITSTATRDLREGQGVVVRDNFAAGIIHKIASKPFPNGSLAERDGVSVFEEPAQRCGVAGEGVVGAGGQSAVAGGRVQDRRTDEAGQRAVSVRGDGVANVSEPVRGLYEVLLTEALAAELDAVATRSPAATRALRSAEASDRIAWHLSKQVEAAIAGLSDADRVEVGIRVARDLIGRLNSLIGSDDASVPTEPGSVLHAVWGKRPDGSPAVVDEPLIPLLDTTLLTNAPGEPSMWGQLRSEIESADEIDVVMAFIRRSGIRPLMDGLRRHCEAGRRLRVLTTTYTGSTERRALDELIALGADVRISYDLTGTRLHAKAWVFHRNSGFSTAYVGSSNLTQSAQVTGLEWNVRLSQARNPDVLAKFGAVFDSYWANGDFVPYEPLEFDREQARGGERDRGPDLILSQIELRALPYQERLLELIAVARTRGHHANLLVAATGTGKTVMAALDYCRLRQSLPRARLLFVAHREEILDQSRATFQYAMRDRSFGEKWVGGAHPTRFEHVFASIQSLHAADLADLPPDHFDVVIVDEFHHAAASSYERFLNHVRPKELLGLTATPERSDDLSIFHWFDGRIAAELRLWDAIDQQHLSPFLYFGIHDGMDLRDIPWRRGTGYDQTALANAYTSSDAWARLVLQQVSQHVDESTMRALGFCVTVEHARFMADHFNRHGVKAVAVWGDSPRAEREEALRDLRDGRVRIVFSVDLFNEGVDVPAVDTVFMLRPTESPTLFLQQLGRGLRKTDGKAHCTVLDFVGTHRKEFRFDRRYRALLGGTRREVEAAIEKQFPFLPAGCSMQLDQKATEVVLRSLRDAIPTRWASKVSELRSLSQARPDVGLADFLDESGLEIEDIYDGSKSWSDLRDAADLPVAESGPAEVPLRRAVGRVLHIDDSERINAYRALLARPSAPDVSALAEREARLLRMLVAQVADRALEKDATLQHAADLLWRHGQVRSELSELFAVLDGRVDHLHSSLTERPSVPLQVHARYTRLEILAAMGIGNAAKVAPWQTGVYEARDTNAELLAFTLDKSSGEFSPTTRYRDYAISRSLIHWESQSVTKAESATGLRYRNHEREGRAILLFTRLRADDRAFWFLGPATYRGHVGERPMAITWELTHPLPGDLYAAFAAAVA